MDLILMRTGVLQMNLKVSEDFIFLHDPKIIRTHP